MKLLKVIGSLLFWLSWPVAYLYFRNSHRTRVIVFTGSKILFVQNTIARNQLALPGGGLHGGENSLDATVRELKEETGLEVKVSDLKLIFSNKLVSEVGIKYKLSSYCVKLPKKLPLHPQAYEILTAEWLDWKDLLDTYHISKITNDIIHAWIKIQHLID